MYSNCLFCHGDLGRNESIEHCQAGRRLAFDASLGRLWVVCSRCQRWNLTPFDERYDAIDECERAFRASRLRLSTDNVGLARLRDGTDLVRVGEALRPEMAAWRFGAQLARRRRNYTVLVGGGIVAAVGLTVGVKLAGGVMIGGNWGWQLMRAAYERGTRIRLPDPASRTPVAMESRHARKAQLRAAGDDSLKLVVPAVGNRVVTYSGDQLRSVAPKVLARVNQSGRSKRDEQAAVLLLESVSEDKYPDLFTGVAARLGNLPGESGTLKNLPAATALALEMALQEDVERVALAGELLELEAAWREAEELANIADSLVPSSVDRALVRLKERLSG